jgi:hypothetical protein
MLYLFKFRTSIDNSFFFNISKYSSQGFKTNHMQPKSEEWVVPVENEAYLEPLKKQGGRGVVR